VLRARGSALFGVLHGRGSVPSTTSGAIRQSAGRAGHAFGGPAL
jgi:hypothetical protein